MKPVGQGFIPLDIMVAGVLPADQDDG